MTYYVNQNAQDNGDHEVHVSSCSYLPAVSNRTYLGDFSSCEPAVDEARKQYTQSTGASTARSRAIRPRPVIADPPPKVALTT